MSAIQLSFLPDNDQPEPTVKRTSEPLVKYIDGHWCWKAIDGDQYLPAHELESILLAAQQQQRDGRMRPRIDNAQLAAEYRAGASTLTLAAKYQRSVNAILYRLMRHGQPRRRQGAPDGNLNWKGQAQ